MVNAADVATLASGARVGAILGLVGGGGSVLAAPLPSHGAGVPSGRLDAPNEPGLTFA